MCRTSTASWWSRGGTASRGKTVREKIDWSLFDMEGDPNETTNVIEKFPEVAARMKAYAEEHRAAFYA